MAGLRAVTTRSRSKGPRQPPGPSQTQRKKNLRTVHSDEEDEEAEEDDSEATGLNLEHFTKEDLYARLLAAQKSQGRGRETSLSPEELAEMEDDPFADQDDPHDEDNDIAHPQKRRLSRIDEEEPDNDEEGTEEHNEDDGHSRPSKRTRSNPKFNSSGAVPIPSNITRVRRKPAPSTSATQTTTTNNAGTGQQAVVPPSSTTSTTALPEAPYTPFKNVQTGKKAREADASPSTRALVKHSNLSFRVSIAVNNAFPNATETNNEVGISFTKSCNEAKADRRLLRYNKDHVYSEFILHIAEQRRSQLRGEVKTKAQALVAHFYKLEGGRVAIAERVKDLITRKTFTFKIPEKRQGMYGHPIFEQIIARQWFAHPDSEGCGRYSREFNPMPLPLIALVATAVHCALMDWETGACESHKNKFEYDVYQPIYQEHLTSLMTWRQHNMARCAARQQGLWTRVWEINGRQPSFIAKADDFDEDDYTRASDDEA
ncbi:hypothetical protein EIP86_006761 [Pleurotus ostreatoroseus]|nr:hypothetical protein EIP86_006761 [Pleurotus ostreatoroseus]